MTPDHLALIRRKRIERDRCAALLADAITRAERWYARREATLAAFDRDAANSVGRLRAAGRIEASIRWHPGAGVPA
jgi:hypothetical protein